MGAAQENEIDVRIKAETSELKPGMEHAANDVERSAERMRQSVASLKDAVQGHMTQMSGHVRAANDEMSKGFAGIAAAFGKVGGMMAAVGAMLGGAVFAAGVAETKKLTGEANALARALGINTTEASALNVALGDIYSSSETFIGASQMLGRQLRTNEEGLNAMGLKTRDANGDFRNMKDLMLDAITVLNGYKEGTDRALAAQTMFGRGGAEVMAMLKLNNEVIDAAKQKQEELGLIVGVENVQANKEYKAAMNDVDDVMSAIRKTIGDAVMPVLTKLGEWFATIGPAAVVVIKGAIGGLITIFWGLKNAVTIVWETINAMVVSVAEPIRALSMAIGKALHGDFDGAAAEIKSIAGNISGAWSQAMDEMSKSSEETVEKIGNLFLRPTDAAPKAATGKSYTDPNAGDDKKTKNPVEKSKMPAWEAELAKEKAAFMLRNDMYEMSLEMEKQYWDGKLATLEKGDKEYGAVEKKSAELRLQILKKSATEGRALAAEEIEEKKRLSLDAVDVQQQAAEQQYNLGLLSYGEMLQLDRQFEQERYEIARQAIEERMALMSKDPNRDPVTYQKLQNQLLEIDRKHAMDKRAIENAMAKDSMTPMLQTMQQMKQTFSQTLTGMLTGAMTLRQGLRNIFNNILNAFVDNMVVEPLAKWAMGLLQQTALYQAFFATKTTQDETAAATTAATNTAEAMSAAGLAGANATASAAAIPLVGWALAPEAGAAVYAIAAGFAATASASGGYDVPSGVNPITQLHQEEMVLPAHIANPLRQSLADGGGMGTTGGIHIHVNSASPKDMIRSLKDGGALHKVLKDYERRFVK